MRFKMTLALVLMSILASAQTEYDGRVGINTETPKASLEIARHTGLPETSVQGVLFPQLTTEQRDKFTKTDVAEGTMIFNLTKRCLEIFTQNDWNCVSQASVVPSTGLVVKTAGWKGDFKSNVEIPAGSRTHSISFFIANRGSIPWSADLSNALTITNEGANGGVAGTVEIDGTQNSSVSLAAGESRVITYYLKGTPQYGTIKGRFLVGIYEQYQNISVDQGFAVFDDYDVYVFSWQDPAINRSYQGRIDNAEYKIPVKLPYVKGDGQTFGEFSAVKEIGTGANKRTLKLTIPGGTLWKNNGVITNGYNVVTGTLEVLETTPYLAPMKKSEEADEEIAEFSVQLTSAMTPFKVKVLVTGGVKDKQYNYATPGLNKYEHRFVYSKVMVYNRQVWLDKNLGAYYADAMRFQDFGKDQTYAKRSPLGESIDYRMLGSIFQWGREADGHELVDWPSTIKGNVSTEGDYFRYTSASQFPIGTVTNAWKRPTNITSYNAIVSGYTEPCPNGWHSPTKTEMETLELNTLGILNTPFPFLKGYRGSFATEIVRLGTAMLRIDYNSGKTIPKRMMSDPYIHTSTPLSGTNNEVWAGIVESEEAYTPEHKIPQALDPLTSPGNTNAYSFFHTNIRKYDYLSVRCIKD